MSEYTFLTIIKKFKSIFTRIKQNTIVVVLNNEPIQ